MDLYTDTEQVLLGPEPLGDWPEAAAIVRQVVAAVQQHQPERVGSRLS